MLSQQERRQRHDTRDGRQERGRDAFYESCDFVLCAQGASGVRGFALYDDLTICYVFLWF